MARYIDADKIVFWIKYVSSNGMLCDTDVRKVAFSDEIARMPTADVAPRAEVADQKARADMCAEVIARQDKEIEKLQDEVKRYKRYYFHHDYDKMIAEVLDELDRFINSNCIVIKDERGIKGYVAGGVHIAISDFKKKYTEPEPPKEKQPKNLENFEKKRLLAGDCFHGEIWYRCPYCFTGIEAYSIPKDRICHKCGKEYL